MRCFSKRGSAELGAGVLLQPAMLRAAMVKIQARLAGRDVDRFMVVLGAGCRELKRYPVYCGSVWHFPVTDLLPSSEGASSRYNPPPFKGLAGFVPGI